MSAKLPAVGGAQFVRALERAGFRVVRIHGSHHVLQHADGRSTSVPVHGRAALRRGTLAAILKNVGLTADDLRALL